MQESVPSVEQEETGDRVEITERAEARIVFLIEKSNGLIEKSNDVPAAR